MKKLSQLYSICYLSIRGSDIFHVNSGPTRWNTLQDSISPDIDLPKNDNGGEITHSIEEQLKQLEEEKATYNRLQRMVRQSREMEMPSTTVETQNIYPPVDKSELERIDASTEEDVISTPFSEYKPIRAPENANCTKDFIRSVVQMPKYTNIEGLSPSFRIKDYTEPPPPEGINIDRIYLTEVNKFRKEKGLEPLDIQLKEGERITDNEEFAKEKRIMDLEKAKSLRKTLQEQREYERKLKSTYYYKLPRDDRGYAVMTKEDIAKLSFEEVLQELRKRGHRTTGNEESVRARLEDALTENSDWRYKNIASQELRSDNVNLPQHARDKLKELEDYVEFLEKTESSQGDMETIVERMRIKYELLQARRDPVGYLDLDRDIGNDMLSPEEIEEIRNAPVIYDTEFFREMQKPENSLPDILQPTFNLQGGTRMLPEVQPWHEEELEELKGRYLNISGGIHDQTLPDISKRFEVSIDFLADACCRLGAKVPIDKTLPLRAIISYSGIWDLLQFLNIADSLEIDCFYAPINVKEMADVVKLPVKTVIAACTALEIKLPFDEETHLNIYCSAALEQLLEHKFKDILH